MKKAIYSLPLYSPSLYTVIVIYTLVFSLVINITTLAQANDHLPKKHIQIAQVDTKDSEIKDINIEVDQTKQEIIPGESILFPNEEKQINADLDGQIIQDIIIINARRIEPLTIITYLGLNPKDKFDHKKANLAIKELYKTGFFSNITMKFIDDILYVEIQENPTINRIAFEGNRKIKDADLAKEVSIMPRSILNQQKIIENINHIINLYHVRGNLIVDVIPKIIRQDQNRVDLVFEIKEGPSAKIRSIKFIGNDFFTNLDLYRSILSKNARWYNFFSTTDKYDINRLNYDKELIRKKYLEKGFLDFQIQNVVGNMTAQKNNFIVEFHIIEGERYKVNNVSITSSIKHLDISYLTKEARKIFKKGKYYNISNVESFGYEMQNEALKQNYPFTSINPQIVTYPDKSLVDVNFSIDRGRALIIEKIFIEGNTRTHDNVIRRELTFSEGDIFSPQKINEAKSNLYQLGYIKYVEVNQTPGSDDQKVILLIQVEEQATGDVKFTLGYNTLSGLSFGIGFSEINLLGKGLELNLSATFTTNKDQKYSFSFANPYLGGYPIRGGFNAFVEIDSGKNLGYKSNLYGGDLTLGYKILDNLYQTWHYGLSYKEISKYERNQKSPYLVAVNGKYLKSEVGQTLRYFYLDNYQDPTRGIDTSVSVSVAGLMGNVRYVKPEYKLKIFIPIYNRVVTSINNYVGYIHSLDNQIINLSDRFMLGGASTVRGFGQGRASPIGKRSELPLGGNFLWYSRLETQFPIGLPDALQIKAAVFFDAGIVILNPEKEDPDWPLLRNDFVRTSAGFGIRWKSPFGPINLDFSWPITKTAYDKPNLVNIGFGWQY